MLPEPHCLSNLPDCLSDLPRGLFNLPLCSGLIPAAPAGNPPAFWGIC